MFVTQGVALAETGERLRRLRGLSGVMPRVSIARTANVLALLLVISIVAVGQKRSTITGVITPVAANLIIIATNQVTSKITSTEVSADGRYLLRVRPGAYRLSVARPYRAKFDNAKNYGEHALIRQDSLENVIVSEGKETKIDFAIEKTEEKPAAGISGSA